MGTAGYYAMAGGTLAHAQLAARAIVALHAALPKTCLVSTSDLEVRIDETDLSTFAKGAPKEWRSSR